MPKKPSSSESTPAPAPAKKEKAPKEAKPVAPAPAPVAEATAVARASRTHTKESLSAEFDLLEAEMASEIERLRTVAAAGKGSKAVGIKQLRTFLKSVRQLHSHAQRVTRFKRTSTASAGGTPQNTGLMKPVRVTPEISAFFGWPADQLQSRVSVTAAVWNYIKQHSLQDANQKRYILLARDPKLAQLLRYDPKVHTDNVSYCSLQKFLKVHFVPDVKAVASGASASVEASPAKPAPVASATPAPAEPKRRAPKATA